MLVPQEKHFKTSPESLYRKQRMPFGDWWPDSRQMRAEVKDGMKTPVSLSGGQVAEPSVA